MAKSLIEKLSLLVRSGINDFVSEIGDRLPDVSLPRSQELDYEVDALRGRVNEALAYEDKLDAELQKLLLEIEEIDLAADNAVASGDDARARILVQRLKRLQQRADMLEHQLQQHRVAAADLISQVNYLDSLVGDIERRKQVEQVKKAEKEVEPETQPVQPPPAAKVRQPEPPRPSKTVRIKVSADEEPEPKPARSQVEAERRLAHAEAAPKPRRTPAKKAKKPAPTPEPKRAKAPASAQPAPAQAPKEAAPPAQPERYRLPPEMLKPGAPEAVQEAPAAPAEEKPRLPEVQRLTDALRKARQNIEEAEQTMDTAQTWKAEAEEQQPPWPEIPDEGPSPDEVDAELAARRSRLSKPE